MSAKGKTLLKGHALKWEGQAVDSHGAMTNQNVGRAQCRCGEFSPVLPSVKKRQQWHREHKDALRAALAADQEDTDE